MDSTNFKLLGQIKVKSRNSLDFFFSKVHDFCHRRPFCLPAPDAKNRTYVTAYHEINI